eukprot:1354730-Lingulodinium_polyedra.AAC.1
MKCPTKRTFEAGTPISSNCCSHLGVCTRLIARESLYEDKMQTLPKASTPQHTERSIASTACKRNS